MMAKDLVFIDTSVFIKENYFDPKNRITELGRLATAGHISLVSTEITNAEVEMHFKEDACAPFRYIRNNYPVLKGIKAYREFLDKKYRKKVEDIAVETCKEYRDKAHVCTVDYSYCNDVAGVFEKYFNLEKPFGEGKKRKEFPDAFALHMLEEYCKKNGLREIVVLSNDKDILKYKSKYLKPTTCEEYLTKKLAEAKTLDMIRRAIDMSRDRICQEIENHVREELDDTRRYEGLFNTEEVSEVEVTDCEVHMLDGFSLLSVNNGEYVLELRLYCYSEAICSFVSLDYATYDREDGVWYGGESVTDTVDGSAEFSIYVRFSEAAGDYLDVDNFEIEDAVPDMSPKWAH